MFWTVVQALNEGFVTALELFGLTLLFALPLGLVIAFGSMSKWAPLHSVRSLAAKFPRLAAFRPISALCNFVVWVIRGTPLMLQLMIIFYGPGLAFDYNPWGSGGRMTASVVAFTINYACYFSVIYRGGIQGVPVGQREAGEVLGMTKPQIFFKITLLQMIKRIVPPMSNEVITLVKDTSIARVISMQEIIWAGYSFMKGSHGYSGLLWPLFFTGVYYLAFNGFLTLFFGWIERKLSYFR